MVDTRADGFGQSGLLTDFGQRYLVLLAGAWLLLALVAWRAAAWHRAANYAVHLAVAGIWIAQLPLDPLLAAAMIVWQFLVLGHSRATDPTADRGAPRSTTSLADTEEHAFVSQRGALLRDALTSAVAFSLLGFGFERADSPGAVVAATGLHLFALVCAWPYVRCLVRGRRRIAGAVLGTAAATIAVSAALGAVTAGIVVAELILLGRLAAQRQTAREMVGLLLASPARYIGLTFGGLILLGTVLLAFPVASAGPDPVGLLDALFTATSAVCVTGLVVLDTPVAFSTFGHAVLVLLIQLGGLNMMVLSTFTLLLAGKQLASRDEHALGEVLDASNPRAAVEVARIMVLGTLVIEAIGAMLLTAAWMSDGEPFARALWLGVFHAVSAFCNAGFALQSDSLMAYADQPALLGVVAVLIVLGGLGFAVLADLWRFRRRAGLTRRALSFHTRLVLRINAWLIGLGAVWFLVLEWGGALGDLGAWDRLSNALFQSVTLRTAGFNSVDFSLLGPATILLMMAWMFIGASPGGTGGGVKTTTVRVLLGVIDAVLRRQPDVQVQGRTIDAASTQKAAAIVAASLVLALGGSVALLFTTDAPFDVLVFEVISALGTVGLSLGATGILDASGKWILIVVMFAGRLGPLAFVLLLARPNRHRTRPARASLLIG